jgi:hypothetical protein
MRIAKKLKKEKVNLDIVSFGEDQVIITTLYTRVLVEKFWPNFFQFDLYAGRIIFYLKPLFIGSMYVLRKYKCLDQIFNKSNLYFQFDLHASRLIREYIRYSNKVWLTESGLR